MESHRYPLESHRDVPDAGKYVAESNRYLLEANRWLIESRGYIYCNLIDIYWNVINIILESGAMVYQRLLHGIAQAVPCKSPWQNMAPWHLAWFLQSGGAMVEWAGI